MATVVKTGDIRELPAQTINKLGRGVVVQTAHMFTEGKHVIYLQATHDGILHESTMTVGAEDGPRNTDYTAEHLQKDLEVFRDFHAGECAYKHHLQNIAGQVK